MSRLPVADEPYLVACYLLLVYGLDLDASVCVWVDGVCRELICVVLAAPAGRVRPPH
jgi:hypothetical protein